MDGTVLVADDDRTIRTVLTQALTRAGCRVHATSSLTTLMRWVEEGRGDAVISDVVMPDGNGIEMLPRIAEMRPALPVIIISAQNTIMTAIQTTEAGAFDYLPKPFDLPTLMKRTGRALETSHKSRASAPEVPADRPEDLPLIGQTPVMQSLYRRVARLVNADLPVLIRGETGTGKSLLARSLHDLSDRRAHPVHILSAADLIGADDVIRAQARAGGGTLVLDGLSGFSPQAQMLVLQLLDRASETGGGTGGGTGAGGGAGENTPRIVSIQTGGEPGGAIREDLYYRLCGAIVDVPPLRDRLDDVPLLAAHFLARTDAAGSPVRSLSPQAVERMRRQFWPGNVRQMENMLRDLALMAPETVISEAEVAAVLETYPSTAKMDGREADERLSESVARHVKRYFEMHGGLLPPAGLYGRILREVEQPLIEIALEATGGNQAKCADLLGINRNTLRKKIVDLDIRVTRRRKMM